MLRDKRLPIQELVQHDFCLHCQNFLSSLTDQIHSSTLLAKMSLSVGDTTLFLSSPNRLEKHAFRCCILTDLTFFVPGLSPAPLPLLCASSHLELAFHRNGAPCSARSSGSSCCLTELACSSPSHDGMDFSCFLWL